MISIIISSCRPEYLAQLKENIDQTIGVPYEVIVIENSSGKIGITAAYNKGGHQSRYNALVFCHEDILFHTRNWGTILLKYVCNHQIALVGVLGVTIKTKNPSGVYSPIQELNRINHLQRYPDGSLRRNYSNPKDEQFSDVAVLDGLFLACSKTKWHSAQFDESGLNRFHGYDIDFSLQQQELGKVGVIYDIDIEHLSFGGDSRDWVDAQLYISKKWNGKLPLIKETRASQKLIDQAELKSLAQLLKAIYKNNHRVDLGVSLTIKHVLKDPLSRDNWYFFKNAIKARFK